MNALDLTPIFGPDSIAYAVGRSFRGAGEDLYVVGASVRDALLGRYALDLDFATSATPDTTASILRRLALGEPYLFGQRYGTVGLALGARRLEITTYRSSEIYAPGSRKPEVTFGHSLLEDLARRDFTVNALAYDPLAESFIDPFGGVFDFRRHILRAVGVPAERFTEDPLRLLRAVRFATNVSLEIESQTWEAVRLDAGAVTTISRERIRDEFDKILAGPTPDRGLNLLLDSGLLGITIPQALALTQMPDHGPRHPLSLWEHTVRAVRKVPGTTMLRWAALLHDIAKPTTRTHEADGRPRFFGHEEHGSSVARDVLVSLRQPKQLVDSVAILVATHMQIHAYTPEWSDGAVRRLMLRLGPLLGPAIALARADAAAHSLTGESENEPRYDLLSQRIRELRREPGASMRSPLNGEDIMNHFDRSPGPWIQVVKDALLHEVLEGRLAPGDRESAFAIAERVLIDASSH